MGRYVGWNLHLLLCAFSLIFIAPSRAGTLADSNFQETQYAVPGGTITSMTWAPDGSNRLFVTIQSGAVRIIQDGVVLPTSFYDFRTTAGGPGVYTGSECGVLSLAFDPNYATNKFVYIFYTHSTTEQRIVRLVDVANVGQNRTGIVPGPLAPVILPTVGANHDGGGIAIGPDESGNGNYLYWAIGNLGNSTAAGEGTTLASFSTLASKVGRSNLDGSAPSTNPYYDSGDGIGPLDYVWASGFRNPFTLTIQPSPRKLWVNVVGQSYEQIFQINRGDYIGDLQNENRQVAGTSTNPVTYTTVVPKIRYRTGGNENHTIVAAPNGAVRSNGVTTYTTTQDHPERRLRVGEKLTITGVGDASFNGVFYVTAVPSLNSFRVSQAGPNASSGSGSAATAALGSCVTGGTFYDGNSFPSAYQGNFFFGDYVSGKIMKTVLNGNNDVVQIDEFLTNGGSITDTNIGPDGALYYGRADGRIYRVHYAGNQNIPPPQTIVVSSTNVSINEGGSASFTVYLSQPITYIVIA